MSYLQNAKGYRYSSDKNRETGIDRQHGQTIIKTEQKQTDRQIHRQTNSLTEENSVELILESRGCSDRLGGSWMKQHKSHDTLNLRCLCLPKFLSPKDQPG